jgi:hypothetical protein
MLLRVALFGALMLAAADASASVAQSLAVKPGLWEVTTKIDTSGAPGIPPEVYDQLPPAQRAQWEARMAQSRRPQTKRTCITQAEIDKGLQLADESRGRCTTTVVSSSRAAMVVNLRCRSNQSTSTGVMRFATTDGKTMTYRFDMTATSSRNNTTMSIKGSASGRWLGADCGNVKPRIQ